MNDKVFIPYFTENSCVSIDYVNQGYLRVYDYRPTANSDVNYTDYFIDKHYLDRTGIQHFSNYNVNVSCIDKSRITSDVMYRYDYYQTLILFLILFIFIIYFPSKIVFKFFKRFSL